MVTAHFENVDGNGEVRDKLLHLCSIVSDRIAGLERMDTGLPDNFLRSLIQRSNEKFRDVIAVLDPILQEVETKTAELILKLQSENGYLFSQGFIDDMCEVLELIGAPLVPLAKDIDARLADEEFGVVVKERKRAISERSDVDRGDRAYEVFVCSEYSRMQFERLQEKGALLRNLEQEIMFYYKEAVHFLQSAVSGQCLRVLRVLPGEGDEDYDQTRNLLSVLKRLRILIAGIRGLKRTRALLNA